ncbi:MAG: DUF1080 domain-containing protein [Phycisphaera sp.]|nr:DUF1080 domain-containing protein [Phycisphaera sp.]
MQFTRSIHRVGLAAVATLGLTAAVMAASEPFNGKDLTGWTVKDTDKPHTWKVGEAKLDPADPRMLVVIPGGKQLVNATTGHGKSQDLFTTNVKHGDAIVEVELMVPKGSNSGIYLQGEYEVQVLDSFGKDKPGPGDMGAIYGAQPPKVNACKAPGEWQKYEIHFQAPRFNDKGEKTANAKFVKVILNGTVIHENVEMKGPTPGGVTGQEHAEGPLMFQGNHGAVAYRNIKISPLK